MNTQLRDGTRLELARRRNEGKRIFPQYIKELTQTMGRSEDSFNFLDLAQTDALRASFEAKRNDCINDATGCFRRTWSDDRESELKQVILKLQEQLPSTKMVLFRELSEYCGAVETNSSEVLACAFRLISLDQNEVMALTEDTSVGISLSFDTDKYEWGDTRTYELIVWGLETELE